MSSCPSAGPTASMLGVRWTGKWRSSARLIGRGNGRTLSPQPSSGFLMNDSALGSVHDPDRRLDERSILLRRLVVRPLDGGARGHIGSSMSLIEIMRVLYDDILRYRAAEPDWPDRDRCILSKGHGCIAPYVML